MGKNQVFEVEENVGGRIEPFLFHHTLTTSQPWSLMKPTFNIFKFYEK